jgi:hypothetical protein
MNCMIVPPRLTAVRGSIDDRTRDSRMTDCDGMCWSGMMEDSGQREPRAELKLFSSSLTPA